MRALLLKSPPFSVLSRNQLEDISRHAQEVSFKKGQVIFTEGEPADSVWVIKKGWLRLTKKSLSDKPITIDLLTPREALCGISVLDHLPYSASATAVTDCIVARIPSQEVLSLVRSNPQFAQELLAICCHRIRHVAESCAMLNEPAPCRVAKTLGHLEELFGKSLPVTHREIAGITGIRIETAIRIIGTMKRQKLLKVYRERIELLRPAKIKSLLAAASQAK